MFCDYHISEIRDTGNKVEVIAYLSEGEYQNIPDPITGEPINQYIRLARFGEIYLMFERSPVTEKDIEKELKRALKNAKKDKEIIPECA
jgi:hypothetical protein